MKVKPHVFLVQKELFQNQAHRNVLNALPVLIQMLKVHLLVKNAQKELIRICKEQDAIIAKKEIVYKNVLNALKVLIQLAILNVLNAKQEHIRTLLANLLAFLVLLALLVFIVDNIAILVLKVIFQDIQVLLNAENVLKVLIPIRKVQPLVQNVRLVKYQLLVENIVVLVQKVIILRILAHQVALNVQKVIIKITQAQLHVKYVQLEHHQY